MTNKEKIQRMSSEELAEFWGNDENLNLSCASDYCEYGDGDGGCSAGNRSVACKAATVKWLESEAEEPMEKLERLISELKAISTDICTGHDGGCFDIAGACDSAAEVLQ